MMVGSYSMWTTAMCRIRKEGNHKASLAIAVRMERLNDGGSGIAMRVSRDLVLRVLGELGYR